MTDGGGLLWKSREEVEASLEFIEAISDIRPDLAPMAVFLGELLNGKGKAVKRLPALGAKKPEKSTPAQTERRDIWLKICTRIDSRYRPNATEFEIRSRMPVIKVYKTAVKFFGKFLERTVANAPTQPPAGEERHMGFDDLFWRLNRLGIPAIVTEKSLRNWVRERFGGRK